MIKDFSIVISNTLRSFVYLYKLKKNKLSPKEIIYIDDKLNNKFSNQLRKNDFFFKEIKLKKFYAKKINSKVSNYLSKIKSKNIIFSSYPGDIIKNTTLLKKKNILHSHPGKLPAFKGSTTIYYSILSIKKIYCSTIILSKDLDSGKILLVKEYPFPKLSSKIDKIYDCEIRAKNLIETLKRSSLTKVNKNNQKINNIYHVIHPLLRSIAFKKLNSMMEKKI
jgi:methionyl-tRNA formyltransferase